MFGTTAATHTGNPELPRNQSRVPRTGPNSAFCCKAEHISVCTQHAMILSSVYQVSTTLLCSGKVQTYTVSSEHPPKVSMPQSSLQESHKGVLVRLCT